MCGVADVGLRTIDLFAGAGGAAWAGRLLGWRTVCYVERDAYCQRVLQARIADGSFHDAPIWDDVRTFEGRPWRGRVDIIAAGVPCQAHSVAARGRSKAPCLWSETARIIREVMPSFVLIENVRGVRRSLPRWISDLRGLGYTVERPITLSAAAVGAGHVRERVWLLAHLDGVALRDAEQRQSRRHQNGIQNQRQCEPFDDGASPWWQAEPGLGFVVHGVADWGKQLRALGGGWVPLVAATAWRLLGGATGRQA
jgi:DNA (cytosine-5)-methyltransferase 1